MTLATKFGRYQVAEPESSLLDYHEHDGVTELKTVDYEPRVSVLDQEDLLAQGIDVSAFIPGATNVDALGSCTANTFTECLSNIVGAGGGYDGALLAWEQATQSAGFSDTKGAEEFAIRFYHGCTDQTGSPSTEWPPTDCGSSGPYIYEYAKSLGLVAGQRIVVGPQNLVSLMQTGAVAMGTPWFNAWMQPTGPQAFLDGDGSLAAFKAAVASGVAGGHEVTLSAIESIELDKAGLVIPHLTVIRIRNHWTAKWGDGGSCRVHLSTLARLGAHADFRQFLPLVAT